MNVSFTAAYRSDNFIVGLMNDNPVSHAPVPWNYTLCGQYPGAVPSGATVTVQCDNVYDRQLRFQFVIVQFPTVNEPLNICEVEVFTLGRYLLYYDLGKHCHSNSLFNRFHTSLIYRPIC